MKQSRRAGDGNEEKEEVRRSHPDDVCSVVMRTACKRGLSN